MNIRRCYRHFDVTPLVVPADRTTTIDIRPRQPQCACDEYEVSYFAVDGYGSQAGWGQPEPTTLALTDGVARIDIHFEGEQEHKLFLTWKQPNGPQRTEEFRFYSVQPDLLGRRPYKGDLHLHTWCSDGNSSPAYVAGACRRVGYDFLTITDHGMYGPSLMAIESLKDVPTDLRIYPGEEVHLPCTLVHILNIGGRESVNMTGPEDHAPHQAEIEALADTLGELPEGVDRMSYAECVWAFDRIRAVGGMGVFCHPYWMTGGRTHPGMPLSNHLFNTQPFDAYEVIGGFNPDCDSNTLQAAHYHELREAGKELPVVGVSDCHGYDGQKPGTFGWQYTIAFAPTPDLADVTASIKELYSVAVESIPTDRPRPVGPLRLVKFALFCEREIFPMHDEFCVEEGRLIQAFAMGEDSAAELLGKLAGRTQALYDRLWASR